MSSFTIRLANQTDARRLSELSSQLGYEVTAEEMKDRLESLKDKSESVVYVAQDAAGSAIGWIHLDTYTLIIAEKQAMILGLVVDKNHRRGGIGKALMKMAEEWATSRGCRFIRLNSTLTRKESHLFYEKIGYNNTKTQFTFMKEV